MDCDQSDGSAKFTCDRAPTLLALGIPIGLPTLSGRLVVLVAAWRGSTCLAQAPKNKALEHTPSGLSFPRSDVEHHRSAHDEGSFNLIASPSAIVHADLQSADRIASPERQDSELRRRGAARHKQQNN